ISNRGKLYKLAINTNTVEWWDKAIKAIGQPGLAYMRFTFLDPGLLAMFVERWHRETCSFHISSGEMTVTLDDELSFASPR
ncbi:serine/threonine-protein phosphatase 7 long form-like protein, partial [Trifolium medium]|nr:serine/threonine-protein phosphatase 7 long form-like protein [Trifolium medium]